MTMLRVEHSGHPHRSVKNHEHEWSAGRSGKQEPHTLTCGSPELNRNIHFQVISLIGASVREVIDLKCTEFTVTLERHSTASFYCQVV